MAATDLLASVLSDCEFSTENGTTVCMRKDEQVLVLEKTTSQWWKVVRSGQQQPFYAPAAKLQERLVPRVRLRSGTGSVRDRRRAPLSCLDAERHISGHEESTAGGWQGAVAASPVLRSSSMDDVLAESPSRTDRAGHSWHRRRQSWAPERHGEGRPVTGPAGPLEPSHHRSRSYQQDMSRGMGSDQYIESGGRPRPAVTSSTWERKGPPPVPPGTSSTWERGATGGAARAPHGASNTWERGGRAGPQFAPPENSMWERKGTSGPIGPSGVGGSWDHMSDGGVSTPRGGSNTWERGKDSVRVRGPMAMSWQTERKRAPLPPPRTRHAVPGAAGGPGPSEPASLSVGRGNIVNQSAPSLAFDAIDARHPPASSLAVRRPSPSSLLDLRALRLTDGHNEGYRRTAERLAGRSESPRPPPAAVSATGERVEGLWMSPMVAERQHGRLEEVGGGATRPVVPPRPSRRLVMPATSEQPHISQPHPHPVPAQVDRSGPPPVPHMLATARCQLADGWAEYELPDGSTYFYNDETSVASWESPHQPAPPDDGDLSSCESLYSESESCSDSPLCSPRLGPGAGADVPLPEGWKRRPDSLGQFCFVRDTSPTRWYSGLNANDHVYFFAESSLDSQWALPPAYGPAAAAPPADDRAAESSRSRPLPAVQLPAAPPPPAARPSKGPPPPQLLVKPPKPLKPTDGGGGGSQPTDLGCGWPQLRTGESLLFIRQGTLSCRIKLSRRKGGSGAVKQVKVWRHWAPCHLVLTDSYLLLFTEVNDPASIQWGSPSHQPVVTVHLAGASLVTDSTASSKKNVLQLTTRLGMQVLLRDDNTTTVKVWSDALISAISDLPSEVKPLLPPIVPTKPQPQVQRSQSARRANDANSNSASESEAAEGSLEPPVGLKRENSRIRRRLKGFFSARPSSEELKRSGILKDERVFGRSLVALCEADHSSVPRFVECCIDAIEEGPDFLQTEGLYRVSAGLDQVQRVRCQVDQENYAFLYDESDPHVLAGALKLFFRELPGPLLPGGEQAEAALRAVEGVASRQRMEAMRALVASLEPAHRNTLELLLRHLTKVTTQEASNRMGTRNLSVVFGPTLTRQPEGDPLHHAAVVMRQNVLVEALLVDFNRVFPVG